MLFASDVDDDRLLQLIDRFLMFYIRTADRLQRTATWFNSLEGGIDYLRQVLIDDTLGLCAELEADMAGHVATYQCEWKATLDDPHPPGPVPHLRQQRPERCQRGVRAGAIPDPPGHGG